LTSCLLHFLVPVYSGRPPFSPNSFSLFEPGGRVFH
jgi:hypothetical protein